MDKKPEARSGALRDVAKSVLFRSDNRERRERTAKALQTILASPPPIELSPRGELPNFDRRMVTIRGILAPTSFDRLREDIGKLVETERNYVPAHKKGGTIAYDTLINTAPSAVALYHSRDFQQLLSSIVGEGLLPTPLRDQSSLSVLFYERPGDHIGWHYDHDFYRGRHFTVLIGIENRGHQANGLSAATLFVKEGDREIPIPTPPNTLVFFEGAKVLHKVTPIEEGEKRVMLSMTYATDVRSTVALEIGRRIKDTAFFGVRALWT